jgi:hypothetical protein
MITLRYQEIEQRLADALPELRLAVDVYAREEGPPGEDPGAYIFFESMFAKYVEVLLSMRGSAGRDRLLARAFDFVESMLRSDDRNVRDLALIGLYEHRDSWWYGRALPFLGPASRAELDRYEAGWLEGAGGEWGPDPDRDIIDLYGVRDVVLSELRHEGRVVKDVPGITAPRSWERLSGLEQARMGNDGVAFLSSFGTSHPFVLCPVSEVRCDESVLLELARDLADIDPREPNQRDKAQAAFFRIRSGERVWNMPIGNAKHARYDGTLWIAERFVKRGLAPAIKATLSNVRQQLPDGRG